jgi:hypothetical protein
MSKRYDVLMVSQQFSPVCWLACAVMIIQFKRGYTPSGADINWRGQDFRTPGLTQDDQAASGTEQIAWLRRLGFAVTRVATPSEAQIQSLLVNHGPFLLNHNAGAFWYGPTRSTPTTGVGHSVVVTGVDTSSHTVYFNNPWGEKDVPTTTASIVGAMQRWQKNAASQTVAYL